MISSAIFSAAAASLIVRLGLLARLHTTRARNPIRDAVSDYGVGATRQLFKWMGLAATAGWWLLALGTWIGYPGWSDRGFAFVAFVVIGATTAAMRFFPTDLVGAPRTGRGMIHYVLAITQFALAFSLMGNVTRLLGDPVSGFLRWIALISLVGLCVCLIPRLRRTLPVFGLFERVFLISVACFYLNYATLSMEWFA